MPIIHSGLVHLISQLLQITSAWWLASMFPLWMQIKLSHTILKPHFKGRTFLHQDRTRCPSSLQCCDGGTLLLPKKEENKSFFLGLGWSDIVPYFRAIIPVLKTFLLPWQVYVLWTGWDAPSLLGCNEGEWRDVVPPSSPALGWRLTGHVGLPCIQLAVGGLIARLQLSLTGQVGDQVFFLRLPVLLRCAIPAAPQDLLSKRSLEQCWRWTKVDGNRWSFLQTVIYNTPKNKPTIYFIFVSGGS